MKKYFLIVFGIFICMIIPKTVFAQSYTGRASVGRSAVLDTSSNYYYTDWTLLSDNSLNSVPIPTSQGNYYHMGSEYSFPITLTGDTYFQGTVKVPVVANTIYNYQLMNGLNENDLSFGVHQNWGVYNNIVLIDYNMTWQCQTYAHLGVAHNYCFYVINFKFQLPDAWTGAYNLNFKVLDTTGQRSAYYYDGYDSNGNAIEFPVASQNSGYPTLTPSVSMTSTGGSSGSNDNTEEITNAISDSTTAITDEIRESYENLVNSQQVCSSYEKSSYPNNIGFLTANGSINNNSNYRYTDYISLSNNISFQNGSGVIGTYFCFYDSNKQVIGCPYNSSNYPNTFNPSDYNSGQNASFVRFSLNNNTNTIITVCGNGNQALYDDINNSDVNDSTSIASGLLEDAQITDKGLTGLVATVLDFINDIFDSTCSPLSMDLPFVDTTLILPCMSTIYTTYFPDLFNLYQLITTGFIAYRVIINLFDKVKKVQDPEYDKVEVLEL